MLPRHPFMKEPLYELIKTMEVDLALGDDSFSLRIELFQSTTSSQWFRARLWRTEFYRLQSTFPQNELSGQPAHHPSDETIQVDWSPYLSQDYQYFQAGDQEAALQRVLDDVRRFLERVAG